MTKTYILNMEDRAGAFLEASRIVGGLGGNIVRVNYNKGVDMHILFLDVEAHPEIHTEIFAQLDAAGYLSADKLEKKIIVLEMKMTDEPGAMIAVLEVIHSHEVNINYINARANDSGYQRLRLGLLIEEPAMTKVLLDEIAQICKVKIVDYHVTEKALDGTVFYIAFAQEMAELFDLDQKSVNRFLIDANNIMQFLDKKGEMPQKTFEYLGKYARFIVEHKGAGFDPIVSRRQLSLQVKATLVEPPCGSNTCVLDDGKELLFVDSGFGCYAEE
ncbi:MAG: MBL fold metallo-hydrolase, partial [Eubacteriales bacterium]